MHELRSIVQPAMLVFYLQTTQTGLFALLPEKYCTFSAHTFAAVSVEQYLSIIPLSLVDIETDSTVLNQEISQ